MTYDVLRHTGELLLFFCVTTSSFCFSLVFYHSVTQYFLWLFNKIKIRGVQPPQHGRIVYKKIQLKLFPIHRHKIM